MKRAPAPAALRASRPERGLTILEVVVAMGILLVGMTAVLGLLTRGADLSRTALLRGAGASAVEAVVADLEEVLFPLEVDPRTGEETVGEPEEIRDRELPGLPGVVYSARATPEPAADGHAGGPLEYRVDVELRWRSGGRELSARFTTLLLREIPFGEGLRRRFVAGRGGGDGR